MVTWGTNTVHNLSTPAPPPGGGFGTPAASQPTAGSTPGIFGAPSPAPGGFGTAPAGGIFGGTATPPASGSSLFGSSNTPATAFGTAPAPAFGAAGAFGSPAPQPGGSIFGGAPGSSSLFGNKSPAPSAFGGFGTPAPAPSMFGQQQQPQQPQMPAEAAMHAHMEAMNRTETEKIKAELHKLYATYTGAMAPTEGKKSKFVSVIYNDLTSDHRQQMWLQGVAPGGQIMPIAPPRPPHVSEEEWNRAVVQNPDPMSYMPVPCVGADALSVRVSWQQTQAEQLAAQAEMVKRSHETVQALYAQGRNRLDDIQRMHASHRKRLLNVMRKVEVVRCMNLPLQQGEVEARDQLQKLHKEVQRAGQLMADLEHRARAARPDHHRRGAAAAMTEAVSLPDRQALTKVLKEHQEDLTHLTLSMKKDIRDVQLMKERVLPASHRR